MFFVFPLCMFVVAEHQTKNEQVDQSNPNKEKAAITAESISQAISSVQPMDTSTSDTTTAGTYSENILTLLCSSVTSAFCCRTSSFLHHLPGSTS